MTINGVPIMSVGDLIARVVELNELWGFAWFRGQSNAVWNVEPRVQRNIRSLGILDSMYEKNLVHRFRGRAQVYAPHMDFGNRAGWLQIMQHHGLPTRLLDWSRSPLVASFFAVQCALQYPDRVPYEDAAIWALDPHGLNLAATNGKEGVTPVIESGTVRELIDGAYFGDDALKESADSVAHPRLDLDCRAVMASESDVRMLVQQGAFTVHKIFNALTPALNEDHRFASCLRKFVIDSDSLPSFAREVEACGMLEGGIYPDLDNLSKELERTQSEVGARA